MTAETKENQQYVLRMRAYTQSISITFYCHGIRPHSDRTIIYITRPVVCRTARNLSSSYNNLRVHQTDLS